jgi:hypothetical protein
MLVFIHLPRVTIWLLWKDRQSKRMFILQFAIRIAEDDSHRQIS